MDSNTECLEEGLVADDLQMIISRVFGSDVPDVQRSSLIVQLQSVFKPPIINIV